MIIYCLGDSNTYGYNPHSLMGGRYPEENIWPSILERETGIKVINDGMNGREIPSGQMRIKSIFECIKRRALDGNFTFADHEPGDNPEAGVNTDNRVLLLIMLGTNDILMHPMNGARYAADRMQEFLTQLNAMIDESGLDVTTYIIAPTIPKRGTWVESDSIIRESEKYITLLCDITQPAEHTPTDDAANTGSSAAKVSFPHFIDTSDLNMQLCFDGVHFTEKDHKILADKIISSLK